ncbi:FHIPEP family protein, partial [Vibrio parahaemolyticus V-223/04]
RSTG